MSCAIVKGWCPSDEFIDPHTAEDAEPSSDDAESIFLGVVVMSLLESHNTSKCSW